MKRLKMCVMVFCLCWASLVAGEEDSRSSISQSAQKSLIRKVAVAKLSQFSQRISLGIAEPGQRISMKLKLRNDTGSPLKIDEVTVSCGCVDVRPGKAALKGGEESSLVASMKVGERVGLHEQYIQVRWKNEGSVTRQSRFFFSYEVVALFDAQLSAASWIVDDTTDDRNKFTFTLRGFRGFDLGRLKCDVVGANVIVHRKAVPISGNESSRELVSLALRDDYKIVRPKQLALRVSTNNTSDDVKRIEEFVVLIPRRSVSVSPAMPRSIDGEVVLVVRFERSPSKSPVFTFVVNGKHFSSQRVQRLTPIVYQVRFSSQSLPAAAMVQGALYVQVDGKNFTVPELKISNDENAI